MRDLTAETWTAGCAAGLMTPEASVASLALLLPGTGATRRSPGEPPCGVRPLTRRFIAAGLAITFALLGSSPAVAQQDPIPTCTVP